MSFHAIALLKLFFHPLGNLCHSKPLFFPSPCNNDPENTWKATLAFLGRRQVWPALSRRNLGHYSSCIWFLRVQSFASKYLEIWDGKILQAGNDHKQVSLPITVSPWASGAHVSLSSCVDLMQKLSNCSEDRGARAPVFTDQTKLFLACSY